MRGKLTALMLAACMVLGGCPKGRGWEDAPPTLEQAREWGEKAKAAYLALDAMYAAALAFEPDLKQALAANVRPAMDLLNQAIASYLSALRTWEKVQGGEPVNFPALWKEIKAREAEVRDALARLGASEAEG